MSREGIRRWIAAVRHAMDTGRIGRQISPGPDHIRIRGTRTAPLIGLPPGPAHGPLELRDLWAVPVPQHAARTLV